MSKKSKLDEYEGRITDKQIARVKRKTIHETISGMSLGLYQFEGYIENVIKTLQNLHSECLKIGYNRVWIDINQQSTSYDPEHTEVFISLDGEREETNTDVRRRLACKLMEKEEKKRKDTEYKEREIQVLKTIANKYNVTLTFTE